MRRILFVANGNGETAIAARIAEDVAGAAPGGCELALFPLVGDGENASPLRVVGPHRTMPSGGLVAMGNVRAFSRDLGAGFATLFARQLAFVRDVRSKRNGFAYDAVVAVGDVYALAFAQCMRLPTIFVGTAKSVYVAPYGRFERALLRRSRRIFVRDGATAERLRGERVRAEAPGNVIVDLVGSRSGGPAGAWLGVLPGSRADAYADGVRLARVIRALASERPGLDGLLSIAPGLSADRFARALAADGWAISQTAGDANLAFDARACGVRIAGWRGDLGAVFGASTAVLGQAGTANEQAAAFGLPVIALDRADGATRRGGADWYRMRQRRLLGDALLLVPAGAERAAGAVAALLADADRMQRMSAAGRERMGRPGGAAAIARAVAEAVA